MRHATSGYDNLTHPQAARRSTRPAGTEVRVVAWMARHPLMWLTPIALAVALARWGWVPVAPTLAGMAGALVVWWRAHPPSFDRFAAPWLRSRHRRWTAYAGRRWTTVLADCDLVRDNRATGHMHVPRVLRVRSVSRSLDVIRVRMVRGQDMRIWTERSEALAHALGAERVTVVKHRPSVVTVVVERRDPFPTPLPAPVIPASSELADLRALDIGDDELGRPMTVSVIDGSHPLCVGATGAGKSGVEWGILRQCGPMIRDGLVRVWMIDLKGGTETELGAPLFHRRATDIAGAVELLGEARDRMRADQERMRAAGQRRRDVTPDTPLDLIVIDEMAMLTAYGDRSQVREALRLLAELMTQGRSSLWTVAGFIQEPTKDLLEVRELFTTRICLGVTAASHVDMALGDGARERGALADEIPLDAEHAGIGFRIDKRTRQPRRLRIGHTTDADIAELVARCAPPPPLAVVQEVA
jgi:S-DNA-T family DNA segregation ATPase FtsK/SpoIIIE